MRSGSTPPSPIIINWRVPTSALRDAQALEAELASKVEYLGSSVLSGGLIMDGKGTLYAGDLEHALGQTHPDS